MGKNNKELMLAGIQLLFGVFLLCVFFWINNMIIPDVCLDFDLGIWLGIGGTCLIWGLKEILEATFIIELNRDNA